MSKRTRVKESRPDPRQNHTFLAEDIPAGGPLVFPHQAGALVGSVMPVTMPDGRLIWFPAPSFTALYLVAAKGHLDRGKRLRTRALAQLRMAHDGKLLVTDKQAVLDCFAEMTKAVLLSYAAIEAVVNEMIESQDDAFALKHSNARGEEQELDKAEVVRRLSTPDKLHRVIPEITGEPSIKGTAYWEKFVRVRRMRDALVHVKEGNYSADPDNPSTYGMLLRGDADDCVLDVCALITKLDPNRLSEAARKTLKIPTVGSAAALGRCGQTCSGISPSADTSARRRRGAAAEDLASILVDVVNIVYNSLFGMLASSFGRAE